MAGTGGQRRRWWAYLGTVAVLGTLSALDPAGLRRYVALSHEVGAMRDENARLAAENGRLTREVRALRSEPAALERAVREELRWIRQGERVYWLGPEKGTAP